MASFILLLLLLFFYEISFILPKVGLMGHFKTKSSIFEGFFSFLQIFSSNLQIIWKLYLIKGIKKWENMDFLTFTGYLYYKTIMSQDVSSKAQIKNFLYLRKIMFHSQDIPGFVFLTIKWFTKSVTSRWVLAGFPIWGGGAWRVGCPVIRSAVGAPPHQNRCPRWGAPPHLKVKPSSSEKQPPPHPVEMRSTLSWNDS